MWLSFFAIGGESCGEVLGGANPSCFRCILFILLGNFLVNKNCMHDSTTMRLLLASISYQHGGQVLEHARLTTDSVTAMSALP